MKSFRHNICRDAPTILLGLPIYCRVQLERLINTELIRQIKRHANILLTLAGRKVAHFAKYLPNRAIGKVASNNVKYLLECIL
jgi:hypothetical protein